jgi:tetratricopeptide (TPR) repeat protein
MKLWVPIVAVVLSFTQTPVSFGELDLKDAPGVYELMEKSISLSDTKERTLRLHHRLKILNRDAIDALGDIKIPYNAHYQKARLVRAETITPDGRHVPVQDELVRDMLPESAQGYSEYSDTRILTFSMPALTRDAVIDYEIEVTFQPIIDELFAVTHFFDHALPVQTSRLAVTLPVDLDMTWAPQQLGVTPTVVTNGVMVEHRWELRDIPGIQPEANLPPVADIRKVLRATSLKEWNAVASWYAGLMEGRVSASQEVKDLAKRLTAGLDKPIDRVNALLYYVQKDVRYVAIELGQGAYQPRPADDCLRNLYGDCKDQSVVLISLLRAAGFTANIALIRPNFYGKVYEELPEPGQFNHAIVHLDLDGQDRWLDPTVPYIDAEAWPEGLDGVEAFVIENHEGRFKTIPALAAAKSLNERMYDIKLSPDGMHEVVFSEYATGRRAAQLRRVLDEIGEYRMEEEMRRNASARPGFQRLLGYKVDALDMLTPSFRYEVSYVSNQILTAGRDSFRTSLDVGPTAGMLVLADWSRGKEPRRQAWVNLATRSESLQLSIKLPPGYKLSNAVRAYDKKLAHGSLALSADLKGSTLIVGVKATLNACEIPAKRVDDLRREVERLLQRADQPLEFVDEPAQMLVNRQPHEARSYLHELMERFPQDPFLQMRIGDHETACGYRHAAETHYAQAIAMDPSVFAFYERWANLSNLYDAALGGPYHRARVIEIIEKSRAHLQDPKQLDASVSMAHATDRHRMLFGLGADVEESVSLAERLVKDYPEDPLILNWRGVTHYHSGEYNQAATILAEALKKGSRLIETQQLLWRSEVLDGEVESGLNRLASVVNQPNQVMSELIFLMQKLVSLGDFDDAAFLARQLAARARRPEIETDLMAEIQPLKGRVIPDYRTMLDQGNPAAAARSFISAYQYGDRDRMASLMAPACDLSCSELIALSHAPVVSGANPELRDLNLAMLFNELKSSSHEFTEDLVRYQVRRDVSSIRSSPVVTSLLLLKQDERWWVIDYEDPAGRGPNLLVSVMEEAWKANNTVRTRALVDYIRTRYSQTDSMLRAMEYRPFLNQPMPSERDQALALIAGALVYSGKQEKVQRGLEYLEELVARYPDAAVLHAHLGVTYAGETRPLTSLKHKTRVLELQGTQENLLADQVQAMLHAGEVGQALKALESLEIEYPACRFRDALRKEYHLRAGELDEALRFTTEPVDGQPVRTVSMLDLFVYLDSGATNAFIEMGEALRTGQPDVGSIEQIGMGYLALGDFDGALEQLEIIHLVQPGSINAQLEQARILLLQGKHDEAQRILDDYVRSQNCPEAWQARLCYVLHGQEKFAEAIASYQVAEGQRPSMAGEYFRLLSAVCYQQMGEEDKARELLKKVATWASPEPGMTKHFAAMLLGDQTPEEVHTRVLNVADYILRKDHLTEFNYYRGMMSLWAGEKDAAETYFQNSISQLRPHHMEYFLARMQLVKMRAE